MSKQETELESVNGAAGPVTDAVSDDQLITMLVDRARSAMEGEITEHLGCDKHDPAGKNSGNSRNGTRSKTVLTDVGPVEISVPRDVAGTFEPQIVHKRERQLSGVDETERDPVTPQRRFDGRVGRACPRMPV